MKISTIADVYEFIVSLITVDSINSSRQELTEEIRRGICNFQLEYLDYSFMLSRHHRRFKDAYQKYPTSCSKEYEKFSEFADTGLEKLCASVAEQIQNYFENTHNNYIKPRIGIYSAIDENHIEDIATIPFVEDTNVKEIGEYKIFDEVNSKGLPYLDNFIPNTIKNDKEYKHQGLDVDKIRADYQTKVIDKKLISRFRNTIFRKEHDDKDWSSFSIKNINNERIYKSHLAVPITFKDHAEKKKLNKELIKILSLPEGGRSILGFIIVDHPETYYFDNKTANSYTNLDVNVLYVYADIISLIYTVYYTYTKGSDTYTSYLKESLTEGA